VVLVIINLSMQICNISIQVYHDFNQNNKPYKYLPLTIMIYFFNIAKFGNFDKDYRLLYIIFNMIEMLIYLQI
jgi:hypothetical protein